MAQELGINIGIASERYIRYDRGISSTVKQRIRSSSLGGTYEERTPDGINIIEETFSASFSNRPYYEITDLIDFFDSKNGVESFLLYVKDSSNASGARGVPVVCENYDVTYVNKAIATLTCNFIKVVTTNFDDSTIYQNLAEFTQGQYTLLTSTSEAFPGQTITFTVNSINVPNGSTVNFEVEGVGVDDFTTDFDSFQIFDATADINLTLSNSYQGSLPTQLIFTLTDYPTASVTVSIFELLPVVPTFSLTKQSGAPQEVDITFKPDGVVLVDGAFQSFWINNPDSFNSNNYQIKFDEDVASSPDAVSSSTPSSAIGNFTSLSSDVVLNITASAPNNAEYTEIHNVTIRDTISGINYTGVLTIILKGVDFVTPTYTLELRNIVESTTDVLYEGSKVEIDVSSNQPSTNFKWDISNGTANSSDYTGTISGQVTTDENGYALIEGPTLVDDIDENDEAFIINLRDYTTLTILAQQQVTIRELEGGLSPAPAPKNFYVNFTMYNSTNPFKTPAAGDTLYPVYSDAGRNNYTNFRDIETTDETNIYYYISSSEGSSTITDFLLPGAPTLDTPATITLAPGGDVSAGTITIKDPIPENAVIKVSIATPSTSLAGTFALRNISLSKIEATPSPSYEFPDLAPAPLLAVDEVVTAPGIDGEVGLSFQLKDITAGTYNKGIYAQGIADERSTLIALVNGEASDWDIGVTFAQTAPEFTIVAGSMTQGTKRSLELNPKLKYTFNNDSTNTTALTSTGTIQVYYRGTEVLPPGGAWAYLLNGISKSERSTVTPITFDVSTIATELAGSYLELNIWILNNGTLFASANKVSSTGGVSQLAQWKNLKWDTSPELNLFSSISQNSGDFRIVSSSPNVQFPNLEMTKENSADGLNVYPTPNLNSVPSQDPHLRYKFTLDSSLGERTAKITDIATLDSSLWDTLNDKNKIKIIALFKQNKQITADDNEPVQPPKIDDRETLER